MFMWGAYAMVVIGEDPWFSSSASPSRPNKRSRLAHDLKEAELRVVALRADLANVDGCLKIFGSDIDPETIKPKPTFGKSPAALPKGAGTRTALEILRETGG
jgi:hypothetical protein